MNSFIQMFHDELNAIMECPEAAVSTYEDLGWIRVDSVEPDFPDGNDSENAEEEVSSEDEALNQEEY